MVVDLNIQECYDLQEAIACEIDKHKKEAFHKFYLQRLKKINTKLTKEIHLQDKDTT